MIPRALVAVALLAAACGTSSVELADEPDVVTPSTVTSSTTTTTTTTTSTTTTTTTTTLPVPPLAFDEQGVPINGQTSGVVRTPTGWVVPVLERLDDGFRVWTPCGSEAVIGSGTFVDSVDIVIDPGHGGSEPGAVGPGGTKEADINLQVSRRVRDGLEAAGYSVMLVRDADVRVPIVTRAEIGRALDPIAFISIHHNAGIDALSPTPGTEMFHQVASEESRRLAGLLYEETREALDGYGSEWYAMSDAGAMPRENREGLDYYGVLRRPGPVLSVLAEFAYITNPVEEELLNRADVQDALAGAVVDAVDRFTGTDDPGSGFTEDPIFRGYGPTGAGRTTNCDDPELE
ncbi:MAG: N-acetylmuramoyl-L-alanine amidase [Acidimicrobiales bacterium]|nr:N-acetylmuramoyl-L-alanine amidase [Acidimicrobiales bacterium]